MNEISVPATIKIGSTENLVDSVWANAAAHPAHVVFNRRSGDDWVDVTAAEFRDDVAAIAKGLIAGGVQAGDRVGLMCKTRFEWTLVDYAILAAGGVTVPVYETSSAEQVSWNLGDSGAVAVFVETADHEAVVTSVRSEVPDLKSVWQIDAGGLDTVRGLGKDISDERVDERRTAANPETLATIIYTSGTTGHPKGCELTHRNMLFVERTAVDGLSSLFNPEGATLLFLPLAHVFARLIQVGVVETRARMGHTADVKKLVPDLGAFQPTFILAVPRVFEKVYNVSKQKAHADGKGKIFDKADAVAVAFSRAQDTGGASLGLKIQHTLFDTLVYSKLRAALGGRCTAAISGGAPLGERLGHFYRGIGLTVFEGYALTETAAGGCLNLEGAAKIGTVGRPIPGVSVRSADDGELLLKGDNVFRGYWHNESATAEAMTEDGWFRTGDLGEIDDDGFVKITGRKKEIIVTAAGKNVSPAVLEDRLRAHPLISQCMVVGDAQPFIGCLVTIDIEAFPAWKQRAGKPADASIGDLREDPDLVAEIQQAVNEANKAVSKAEAIKKFRIVIGDFTLEGGQLTPKLSIKRAVVLKEQADEVAAIYS